MDAIRKPYQGVWNIIRFNWHFYFLAGAIICALYVIRFFTPETYHWIPDLLMLLIGGSIGISLLVSAYVYDLSGLYSLSWLNVLQVNPEESMVNIHAGFDETSALLKSHYPSSELVVYDFYHPEKHTELSIKRARKVYPPFQGTRTISTSNIPLENSTADKVFAILSAHEIRDEEERITFFREIERVLKSTGKIIVTEHLRDTANFLAYNFGFFHFHSRKTWLITFENAGLVVEQEIRITPFITTFILNKNGTAH